MLSKKTRLLLLKAIENGIKVTDVAKAYCVDRSTVNRLIRQMKETGSIEPKTYLRGRKTSITEEDLQNIDNLLKEQPDLTIREIKETLNLSVCEKTVRKAVLKLGYVYKKKSLHASEQERPRCTGTEGELEQTSVGTRHKESGVSG
ncbi:MAG: helix-turn-helix domain-containing protein [Clostridia bacterium]|nr:helix-turn-helix domain-containing protein [Clostridia bacterium]